MNASEIVRQALAITEKTQKDLADHMGWSRQNLNARLKNGSLSYDEVCKALAFTGYHLVVVDAAGCKLPKIGNTTSPQIVQMVDGVTYDTGKAESICMDKQEGQDYYMELFRCTSGAFFMAYYQDWEGGYNHISPVTKEAAQKFMKQFGSHDNPLAQQ